MHNKARVCLEVGQSQLHFLCESFSKRDLEDIYLIQNLNFFILKNGSHIMRNKTQNKPPKVFLATCPSNPSLIKW